MLGVYDRPMPKMIRKHIHMTEGQVDFLEGFEGLPLAEHIRRALDSYITKKKTDLSFSTSSSKKGVEIHG